MPYYIRDKLDGKQLTPLCRTKANALDALIKRDPRVVVMITGNLYTHTSDRDNWRAWEYVRHQQQPRAGT